MATETSPRPRSATPATIPQKRPMNLDDEQHIPAVSSPLNPDAPPSRARKAPAREQREKKESLKKREAKGVDTTRSSTPDAQPNTKRSKKVEKPPDVVRPVRYHTKPPSQSDFDAPRPPVFNPVLTKANRDFNECFEHISNKKSFRYTNCIADPAFPSSRWFRQTDAEPFEPRFSFQEASSHILFDSAGRSITTEKGFRMARANVCAREGRWYYECKILSGVKPPAHETSLTPQSASSTDGGHVRLGWARREANLDTPVGFDAYSYGLRDVSGQKIHLSRPKDFVPSNESFCEGDVIGLELTLPSLALHRKVVEGSYNKAVDVSDDLDPHPAAEASDFVRDRVPIRYKGVVYFEQFEYSSSKDLEDLMNPAPSLSNAAVAAKDAAATAPPNPNHPSVALRTLPFSSIKVYKNGKLLGTPFTDLFAFLPPASKAATQQGARDGLDDGMLGYFPAISVFRGGAAEINFGPEFWCPPSGLATRVGDDGQDADDYDMNGSAVALAPKDPKTQRQHSQGKNSRLRGMGERYVEQIAEDIVYDLIDEVDFWMLDAMENPDAAGTDGASTQKAQSAFTATGMETVEGLTQLGGGGGEIKEIVQEEE
ncbi:transcription factor, contains a PHD finger motif [Xanthoria calcicola]